MFAYCGNNHILRKDDGGDIWHIAVGAVAGGLIGGVVKVLSNAASGTNFADGLATAMLAGAASGAVASSGIGLVGVIGLNATISMAENVSNRLIDNGGIKGFRLNLQDVGDILTDGAIGAISGALGGAGSGSKHLTRLGKQTIKRTTNALFHKGIRSGFREARRAFSYYSKNTVYYYKPFINQLPKDVGASIITTIASSNFMKTQYRKFGRMCIN